MKRGRLVLLLVLVLGAILLFPFVSPASMSSEIQKITSYAEDYETGNINYIQLLVYTSAIKEEMNVLLGVTDKEYGGILKQQQIEEVLGEPTEITRWVWAEGLDHDIRLNTDVPFWRKIIFDGKKIQIRLNAHPSIFLKQSFDTEEEKEEFKREFNNKEFTEEDVIYRLDIEISFKRPEDKLDFSERIGEIKELAEEFNSDPSKENAEELAKASVDTEKLFWNYFEQSSQKCETLMSSIFGSENKREDQKLVVQEIYFYEGENFEVKLRLEMCDECQWKWVGLDMWIDSRGKFKIPEDKTKNQEYSKEKYASMENEEFKSEIASLLDEIKSSLDQKDFEGALSLANELKMLSNAWNEKSNNVWKELDQVYRLEEQSMTDEERRELNENYGWIKREQERRQKEMGMREENYQLMKEFYLDLFSGYDKSEFYYTQVQFEKRLIEEFVEFGEEICDNNKDDNQDNNMDCADSQCGGKFCGKQEISVTEGNQTLKKTVDLYCIAGVCQAKEEIIEVESEICGNHICEMGESKENCVEDCSECTEYEAINCSGKVIFSGVDVNNCPLPPICVEESKSCTVKEDCIKPLCGEVDCIEGECELTGLVECEEEQCTEGTQKILKCDKGEELVKSICISGVWNDLDVGCVLSPQEVETPTTEGEVVEEEIVREEVLGNACSVREDCGNENDVCSNGNCVTIPEAIKVEPQQTSESSQEIIEESNQEESEEQEETTSEQEREETSSEEESENTEEQSEPSVTAEVVSNLFKGSLGGLLWTITGREIEEGEEETNSEGESEQPPSEEESGQEPPQENFEENQQQEEDREEREEERRERDEERRREEERERRKEECGKQCNEMCYNMNVRPCVDKCIWENCGDMLDCDIDEESEECENKCKEENDLNGCIEECSPKCLEGGEKWWEEFQQKPEENQKQMEKGVFNSGGGCRTSQGKTEAFIWFNGWGEPFQEIEPLKQKYYTGGQTEWCKYDLDNLMKQREEFEKGFNQEFVKWFFEDYLANSAEDWEQHVSGIFEIYWKNIDTLRQMAERMGCLEMKEFPVENLISVQYESEYGKIEYWEELKTVQMEEMGGKEITIVSPYMKVWIFPSKEFLEYEMKKAMTAGEFPGSNEDKMNRKDNEGLTEEERNSIKQNSGFMNKITKIAEKYNGNLDLIVQLKDFETNEVVFNLYVQVNEKDIITMQPMLPEQVPSEDVRIEVNFQEVYDLIYSMEKEMQGEQTESPPWDKQAQKGGIKELKNGIQMFFKIREIINSAQVYPEDARGDIKGLTKSFFKMMMKSEEGGEGEGEEGETTEEQTADKTIWEDAEKNSGEK